ncbi:TPA: class I SAM-dependent methyltransferase [Clostridium botulinum]|uniref:Class I SAM-dependent methyltransferase n=1 Tax=Clostridium botulinum TaxID=1491 RepID=A0ABD7CM37_CLOBO|nr:class I SAM-dependent methyltransferase [Clostridium botulinum]MCC5428816.1 methyltransferase domain-containing protein [Clostridium botulinum]NFA96557.1 class I SAM-dependent methyltransferase [Clostridium botulinum]NFB51317.1 class I SAM-dependent methyltransferase [Clostridium botulinum]NFC75872.1 class I SAM-dependent methyltransferase [Clostridium botulinum]NFC87283.1 class I SAM-dependent methyltransferase [Clostridium botulinum]
MIKLELSPKLYHYFVRPKWFTEKYIENRLRFILADYNFTNKSILDFGCGIGSNSIMFNPKDYLGVDYDKKRINYAKKMFYPYKFNSFDGINLPVSSNSIDYIIIIAVLHHINKDDITNYLNEFRRVLKPTGEIIIIEPCFFKDSQLSNFAMKFLDKGRFIRSKEEYVKIFKDDTWQIKSLNRFKKCIVYNEIFFSVALN